MNSDGYFGERVASTYDDDEEMFDPSLVGRTVDFLQDLAGSGSALELGVGTGRIALPLAERGVRVHGIDLSRAMVSRLQAKPGGSQVAVTIGDFATTTVEGQFDLAYLVFNTIINLTTQDAQVACFRNAANHLDSGGRFVIEVFVPRLQQVPVGGSYHAFDVSEKHWGIDEYDIATQSLTSHHMSIAEGGTTSSSTPFRYVWPAELDLMAQLAGMKLKERWGSWQREPFTSESDSHVSVWQKA